MSFYPYFRPQLGGYQVFVSQLFRDTASEIYRLHASQHAALANANVYMEIFARGGTLAGGVLKKEGKGFAISTGSIRCYFIYSDKYPKTAIFMRARFKRFTKAKESDLAELIQARKDFDALNVLPQ